MKIETLDDQARDLLSYFVAQLAVGEYESVRQVCHGINEIITESPEILDTVIERFNECDDASYKEVMARMLIGYRDYAPAQEYIKSLKDPIHHNLRKSFKWVKLKPYKPPVRVPDSEVIAL